MSKETGKKVTLKERMVSASAGSLVTSLFLTPLDVVRVRLQQQEMLPSCTCTGQLSKPAGKVFWQDECFANVGCREPAARLQGTLEGLRKIAQLEGLPTLWRGLGITLVMAVPANVVYFSGYEALRDNSPLASRLPVANPLVCGAFARILAATTIAPLELLRTRLQSVPRARDTERTIYLIGDLLREMRHEVSVMGYRALFKGLEITLWRDVPFSAIYWGTYEFCKTQFWARHAATHNASNWDHFIGSFACGSMGGAVAALLTHPFDVGKTRMQIAIASPQQLTVGGKATKTDDSRGMFSFLNAIRKSEGIRALYTGLLPRVMKIAPSCAIMISTYELSKKFFTS
ncbi:AFR131Cp [Eremothecium gossypii ATCC 10895]|uniref:AFR131Cp n=1 Tax=Eremothecium gossypii (strain ATCC 10895 / CBS 109.51 / FGSC 9923 / NRRL Y-1056) TaxID=284811 RepID=Q754D9_EREGS|nr:AFR131Cp [Eremothecium gossypii ATCC 10895]AAS53502.2 AFR131Cp [Eremothecium gossypii ATCC 10895]AEY97814.1 FAFR131Cp [Eremothecium gossypii FDAG1]